jgi:hypothetical protein
LLSSLMDNVEGRDNDLTLRVSASLGGRRHME